MLSSRHDSPVDLLLPAALSSAGQRTFAYISAEMPELLPFGFGGTLITVTSLGRSTVRMHWAHVVMLIPTSQLQGSDVLDDPALADAIDLLVAHHTSAA
jgi:hypothetical protein